MTRAPVCFTSPAHRRGFCFSAPVDSDRPVGHIPRVSKKPHKVEEPKAAYPAKKPAKVAPAMAGEIRYATPAQTRKAAAEVFEVHKELFRRLAQ